MKTVEKKIEEELHRERYFTKSILDTAQMIILVLDPLGRIDYFNPYFEILSGYTLEEVQGKDWFSTFIPIADQISIRTLYQKALTDIQTCGNANLVKIKNGKERLIEWHDKTLKNSNGTIIGVLSVGQDITERKRAEEERLELERKIQHTQRLESLGVLAGGIAHDFNNLLLGIMGNITLISMDLPDNSPHQKPIETIKNITARLTEIARQMLDYTGKGKIVDELCNLSRIVVEMTDLLRISLSKKINLVFDLMELPDLQADQNQLHQVVLNLVTNAAEAIGDNIGTITIRTGFMEVKEKVKLQWHQELVKGTYIFLEVIDTGCGISLPIIDKIFDPFFTTKFTGRGLGLCVVQGIIRGHKGAIQVHSEPNKRTSFKTIFPSTSRQTATYQMTLPSLIEKGNGETILVVDDEEVVREVAILLLKKAGFSSLAAEDGEIALKMLSQNHVDAVLLDLSMPRMDGVETFSYIKDFFPNIPVIITSGYSEQSVMKNFLGKGLSGFIAKPYDIQTLTVKLTTILQNIPARGFEPPLTRS